MPSTLGTSIELKKLVVAISFAWLVLIFLSLVIIVRTFGPIVGPIFVALDPHPHNEACAALADLAEKHFGEFSRGYRMTYRLYGRGMGGCDPSAPDVRYEYLGHYRPGEARSAFIANVMSPLRLAGWRRGQDTRDGPTTRIQLDGATVDLLLNDAGTTASNTPGAANMMERPELFDLVVSIDHPIPGSRSITPEYGAKIDQSMLNQMTLFYPQPLPSGMTIDDSSHLQVTDYSFRDFSISDGNGRESRVGETPSKPITHGPCDLFDPFPDPRLHLPAPVCPRIATSRSGQPIYESFPSDRGRDVRYGLLDGDTEIVVVFGLHKKPLLERDEVIKLIDSLRPTNLARKQQ